MLNPPAPGNFSQYDDPLASYQDTDLSADVVPHIPQVVSLGNSIPRFVTLYLLQNVSQKRKSPIGNRIIPFEEDMRRLFQQCQIGQGNALLLSEALVFAKPEDLNLSRLALACDSSV